MIRASEPAFLPPPPTPARPPRSKRGVFRLLRHQSHARMPRPANVSQLARIVCATLFHVRRGAFGSRANGTKRDHPLRSGAAGAFRVVRPGPTAPSAITSSAPRAGSPVKPPLHQRALPTPVRPRPARRRREGVKTPGLCPRPRFFFGLCCGCDQRGPVPLFARLPGIAKPAPPDVPSPVR